MLVVSLALLLIQPSHVEKLNVSDVCSFGNEQFKSFRRNWSKEIELQGTVAEIKNYDDFSDVKIVSHKDYCKITSIVLMPKEVVVELEIGTSVRLRGNFLIPTYGKCSTRWSIKECTIKFVLTNRT